MFLLKVKFAFSTKIKQALILERQEQTLNVQIYEAFILDVQIFLPSLLVMIIAVDDTFL